MRAGPSQDEIRRYNLGALLRHVHILGPTSRAQLTTLMGLNRSTIGALTADLAAAGLIREEQPRSHRGAGRPSLVVSPASDLVYVLAFSVRVDRVVAARVGLGGVVLDRRELIHPRGALAAAEVLETLGGFATEMRRTLPGTAICAGAGAAVSGLVRADDGLVSLGPNLGWHDEPFGERLTGLLGEPVAVGNDADLSALAEHTRGVASACSDVLYLHGDVGIGCGIISGGRLLRGHEGFAGEAGHMVVNPAGKPCSCGSAGCWETEIGEQALLAAAGRPPDAGRAGISALIDAASRGDTEAQGSLRAAGDWLGFGVANLVNLLNPQMVVFGGTLRDVYLASAAQVRGRLNRMSLRASRDPLKLRTPALGEDLPLLGAAELAFTRLLADPLASGV
ncbi:ROK family protein [Longispora albida]|uniref:ROK family protein n=1 Tax=Longispora albida TaxID=203523 RepID=UPI00037CFAE6|nr:ROK family protein [Longispora albida]